MLFYAPLFNSYYLDKNSIVFVSFASILRDKKIYFHLIFLNTVKYEIQWNFTFQRRKFQVIHLSIRLQEARRTFKKKKTIVRVLIRENDRNYDISMQNSSDEYLTFFVHDGWHSYLLFQRFEIMSLDVFRSDCQLNDPVIKEIKRDKVIKS